MATSDSADDDSDPGLFFNVSPTTIENFREISNADEVKDNEATARLAIKADRMKFLKHDDYANDDDDADDEEDVADAKDEDEVLNSKSAVVIDVRNS